MKLSSKDKKRFFSKVNKRGPKPNSCCPCLGNCWKWLGKPTSDGYGQIKVAGHMYRAHRYSWLIHFGKIATGKWVLHKCDNPLCVNPDHLIVGTHRENVNHMVIRKRNSKGEDRPAHKLTEKQVIWCRRKYTHGHPLFGVRALAKKFGVCQGVMRGTVFGTYWKHLPNIRNKKNRLTSEQKLSIKKQYIPYHPTQGRAALAKKFGVSKEQIRCIVQKFLM